LKTNSGSPPTPTPNPHLAPANQHNSTTHLIPHELHSLLSDISYTPLLTPHKPTCTSTSIPTLLHFHSTPIKTQFKSHNLNLQFHKATFDHLGNYLKDTKLPIMYLGASLGLNVDTVYRRNFYSGTEYSHFAHLLNKDDV
jgi:hypothetical protein